MSVKGGDELVGFDKLCLALGYTLGKLWAGASVRDCQGSKSQWRAPQTPAGASEKEPPHKFQLSKTKPSHNPGSYNKHNHDASTGDRYMCVEREDQYAESKSL